VQPQGLRAAENGGRKTLVCKRPNEANLTASLSGAERRGTAWRRRSPHRSMKEIVAAFLVLFSFLPAGRSPAGEVKGNPWQSIETRYTVIRYRSSGDLRRFNLNLKFSAGSRGFFSFSFSQHEKDTAEDVGRKVDAIFERVQEILDMRKSMKKVLINIYHDSAQLETAFFEIYQKPCRIRAWYRYWNNTIYVNAGDLQAGMLAHEMAHAVIDHYMVVRPPRATAEILARYVDEHLEK
jgi:hypothetical protein